MKKIAAFCACCLMFTGFLFARGINSVQIATEGVNLGRSENSLIQEMVAGKLDSNLSKYTDIVVINSTNKNDIVDVQKKSNDFLEAGKYKIASHILFVKITKAKSNYIITVRFTNLTTGENIATVTSNGRKNYEDLYSGHGCAVDEITIELNNKLHLGISPLQKKIMMEGEESLSDEEKDLLYAADIKQYENIVSKLDAELKSLKNSSNINDIARSRALKAKKDEAEEKLNLAAINKKRAEHEAKKRQEDNLKNKDRTSEQINKLNSMSSDINSKVAALRQKKQEELSLLQAVKIIESKKETYIDTRNQLNKDLAEMQNAIDKKRKEVIEEIDNRPYRIAELSNGRPTEDALKNREKEKEYAMDEIDNSDVADMKNFNKKISSELKKLEKEISSDYKSLKPKTLTSLTNELVVTYGGYDGTNKGWPLYVSVQIDDISILETESFLPYYDVTGKKTVDSFDPENPELFKEFADNVDFYNSLFSQGKEILTFSIDYNIYPMDKNHPSEHNIKFTNFNFYETKDVVITGNRISSKPKGELRLNKSVVSRQFYPVHDMRTEEDAAKWDNRHNNNSYNEPSDKYNDKSREEYKEDSSKDSSGKSFKNFNYISNSSLINLFSVNFEAVGGDITGAGIEASYNFNLIDDFYLGYTCDILFSDDSKYFGLNEINTGMIILNQVQVGYKFNLDWLFGDVFSDVSFMTIPELYTAVGVGFGVCSGDVEDPQSNFITELQLGVESKVADTFQILSGIEILLGFGEQEVTKQKAMTCFSWTLGAGYRF